MDATLENFIKNESLQDFKKLDSDQERMEFILKKNLVLTVPWVQAYFEHCNELNRKSEKKSISARQEGNHRFKKKQFLAAMELYTKSLLLAPFECEQLSLGYSNRSAALYHLSEYEDCLADIQQTFLCQHIPDHLHAKLISRKGQCLFHLQRYQEAMDVFLHGKSLLEKSLSSEKIKVDKDSQISQFDKWIQKVKLKHEQCNFKTPVVTSNNSNNSDSLPMVSYGSNEVVVKASSAVKLCNNADSRGRHLLAQHKIKAGDVLIVEKPYAAVLLPDSSLTHCHSCFVKVSSPIPCAFCCTVQYCSQKCREIAWNLHHWVECQYMTLLHSVGIAHLSLRIILVTGLRNLLDFKSKKLDSVCPKKTAGLTEAGQYDVNYLSVYMLMAHSSDMLAEDLLQYAMTAALLLHILDHAGWFHSIEPCPANTASSSDFNPSTGNHLSDLANILKSESHLNTAAALLRHIQQLVCNAHAITKIHISEASPAVSSSGVAIQTTSQVRVATAIYPTASLMNHSCEPTITSSFQKDTLIVRAVKDVEPEGEIFNCYGPHSYRMTFEERQQILKDQYFFDCTCNACKNAAQQKTLAPNGMCPKCINPKPIHLMETGKLTCNHCGYSKSLADRLSNIAKAEQAFTQGLYQLDSGNIKVALELFESSYSLRKAELPENDREIGEVLDCIARCLASLGQYEEACKFLTRSIFITRHCYGSCSLELAQEYQKYCDMLYLAGMIKKALKSAAQAKEIFLVHYGPDCPEIKELTRFEKELKAKKEIAI